MMAAPPTFTLLRVAPLLSSTAATNRLLSANFKAFAPYGMAVTANYYFLAIGPAAWNLAFQDGGSSLTGKQTATPRRLSAGFYLASIVFNALHFAFAPHNIALMNIITDEDVANTNKGKNYCTAMADWVSWTGSA
ncbi:hypothetical protein F4677DRAFT_442243 [Hypoxylon crocopeplum]|nr:hypothetical protein F4677DRAFT_442243 [Hypoxylon crocopeplum]